MEHRRYLLRRLLILALSLSCLLALSCFTGLSQPRVAFAHAFVIGSDPAAGSTIASSPADVRIFFSADISSASIAHVYLFTTGSTPSQGQLVDAASSSVSPTNPRELDTPLLMPGRLPQGSYTVSWTALATGDGHATSGVIGFNVGYAATGLSGTPLLGPSTGNALPQMNLSGILAVMWEWLTLLVLACWVGTLVMEALISGTGEEERIRKQDIPLLWLCSIALLVGEIINLALRASLLAQALNDNGIDLAAVRQLVLGTSYGHLWLVRLGLICIALGYVWWTTREQYRYTGRGARRTASNVARLRRQVVHDLGHREDKDAETAQDEGSLASVKSAAPPNNSRAGDVEASAKRGTRSRSPQLRASILLVLAGLILLSKAFSGDVVQSAQQPISAVVFEFLFLAAEGIWFGGVVYLGFVLIPLLQVIEPDHYGQTLAMILRRYRPVLLAAIGALLVSGLFLSEAGIPAAQQLFSSPYGLVLLVKIVLIAIVLAVSGYYLFIPRPALTQKADVLPVVNAEFLSKRTGRAVLGQTIGSLKGALRFLFLPGAGVLLCTALMSFYAPPIASPAIIATQSGSTSTDSKNIQTKQVGDLSVKVVVLPARLNAANTVIVSLIESNGNPVTDAQVQITINMVDMDMGTIRETARSSNSTYIAIFASGEAFSMYGDWTIDLSIQRTQRPTAHVMFVVTLTG